MTLSGGKSSVNQLSACIAQAGVVSGNSSRVNPVPACSGRGVHRIDACNGYAGNSRLIGPEVSF